MAASPKRIAWDACAWIAYIHREKAPLPGGGIEDRFTHCQSVLKLAEKGTVEIAVSGLCLVEVCKNPAVKGAGEDKISSYFDNDYVLVVPVDRDVGTLARKLIMAKHAGLMPADATHLASAVVANCDELNTFDEDLLNLNGKIQKPDGTMLKICKPGDSGKPLPLLKVATGG